MYFYVVFFACVESFVDDTHVELFEGKCVTHVWDSNAKKSEHNMSRATQGPQRRPLPMHVPQLDRRMMASVTNFSWVFVPCKLMAGPAAGKQQQLSETFLSR